MFQASTMQLYLKKTSAQIFSCEICEFFKKSMFIEHIQVTASGNKRSWKQVKSAKDFFNKYGSLQIY